MDSYVDLTIYNAIHANFNTAPLETSAERRCKKSQRWLLRHLQLPTILLISRNCPEDAKGRSMGNPMDMSKVARAPSLDRRW